MRMKMEKLVEQAAVKTKEQAQALGDGDDELAVPNRLTDLTRDVLGDS